MSGEESPGGHKGFGMSSISKWAVLVLSFLSLAIVGCGDDKTGNDGGHGGSAGDEGTAGTDEGTAGTDEGTAGTDDGNPDDEEVEISPECQAACDRTYLCGYSYNNLPQDECYAACEKEFLDEWKECLPTATCEDIGPCTWTCERAAEEYCTEEPSSTCWPVYFAHVGCMVQNDCVTERGVIDYACMNELCSESYAVYQSCIENDCQEYLACQD